MSSLEQAEAVRTDLDAKLFEAKRELVDMDEKRISIAFAAHTGDADAKKSLDRLNRDRAAHIAEIETISAALAEAQRRVDEAERDAELATLSTKAERALEIGSSFIERGRKIDEALATVAAEAIAFKTDLDELNRLGCTHPNSHQLFSHGSRALLAALMSTPLQIEHLAPRERQSFAQITSNYATTIDRWTAQYLAQAAE